MYIMETTKAVVVIGGGIAGTSCVEALLQNYDAVNPQFSRIVLISESNLLKHVTNYELSGRRLERFDIALDHFIDIFPNIPSGLKLDTITGSVTSINVDEQTILYSSRDVELKLDYDILCVCTGSKPRQLSLASDNPGVLERIIVIRDTHTVSKLEEKLKRCGRIVIVGNGGISLELVSKISNCERIWIIRDESIGSIFFDSGASKFLLAALTDTKTTKSDTNSRDWSSSPNTECATSVNYGPALGPNWLQDFNLEGNVTPKLDIVYKDEILDIALDEKSRLIVSTKNGKKIICDLVAAAVGVLPNPPLIEGGTFEIRSSDGGILIDTEMRTSIRNIYAAGDVVSCDNWNSNNLWFQMRLWTQARQMGYYAGQCITAHIRRQDPRVYFNFDCFTHCTKFFGFKLVLLGNYNGQLSNQDEKFEVFARVNPGKDYVKILISSTGKLIGAVLVGDSGLEETLENLIHDQIDVSAFKENLLDDTVDIEDYFD